MVCWLAARISCVFLVAWAAAVVAGHRHTVCAQEIAGEWALKPIVEKDGVLVKYVLYQKADGWRNGVVIFLRNTNEFAVKYRFTAVFRSEDSEETGRAEGHLDPGEAKTGGADGLFWIPFEDDTPIVEIGVRGLSIESAE